MPLLVENLLLLMLTFAIGLGIGRLIWARDSEEI